MVSCLLPWIWAVCREPHSRWLSLPLSAPHPPPRPVPGLLFFPPPVRFAFPPCLLLFLLKGSAVDARARCKPEVLDTKHRPICFHFLPVFKLEFLSPLSTLIGFWPPLFPPPSSFSSPPSLLFFVSHPIQSVFPCDGELQ